MSLVLRPSRRQVVAGGAGLALSASAARAAPPPRPDKDPEALAGDDAYWSKIAGLFEVSEAVANLENGYWGVMARPVAKAFHAYTERINRENSYYARREFGADMKAVYGRLAGFLGVGEDELLLTRNASEALQILIGGYNRLKPGDGVLYADLDYSAMKTAMAWLEDRRGASPVKITLPEPASREGFIEAYRDAFDQHPEIHMALVTHVNNLTGAIHPVREIAALAKERGIDVILDAAHAIGQIDFAMADLGADFIGMNLHKWIGAPLGCGLIYIRKERIRDIDRFMGEPGGEDDIRARAHLGAVNFAAPLTIPDALAFHEAIGGAPAKEARLRRLRNLWVGEARDIPGVDILTPDDPATVAAMTSFRIRGRTSTEDNNAIVRMLSEEHGVFTVRRSGPAAGDCVRVTPSVYNSAEDAARLAPALAAVVKSLT